jgi:hypothetical protein
MASIYHNITGSSATEIELLAPGDEVNHVESIVIANTHATADATISLYIQRLSTSGAASNTFYLLSTVAIPSDTSLLLDNPSMLSFDNSTNGFGLYITVGDTDTLDVLVNQT